MPNHDGTGPDGKGPMTGRGMGNCILPLTTSKQELDFLKNQAQMLQAQLKKTRTRIKALETRDMVFK
jgi:hypothetical protein